MEKQKKVVDASVVVKWFLKEEGSEIARKLRNDLAEGELVLIVPDIIYAEVLNALRYKMVKLDYLIRANDILSKLDLSSYRINKEMMIKTIENSIKYNITIYDALYITLAQLHGTFLITADKELYKIPNVISLDKI